MLLIVLGHFCFYALLTNQWTPTGFGTFNFVLTDALLVVSCSGVNLFVLISGYFLVEKELNLARVLRLWLQVLFYSVLFSAVGWIIGQEPFSAKNVLNTLLPIYSIRYWFVGPYIGMVLLAPFLSKTVYALTQKEYQWMLIILIGVCCTFTLGVPYGNKLGAENGFSLIWFITLFFTGGYFRRFDPVPRRRTVGISFLVCAGLIYLFYLAKAFWRYKTTGQLFPEYTTNNSFAFPLALLLFVYFKKLPATGNRTISLLAGPATLMFGVYLIHEHPIVREWLWQTCWSQIGLDITSPWLYPAGILFCGIIFLLCCGIEWGRKTLFRLLQIDSLLHKITHRLK